MFEDSTFDSTGKIRTRSRGWMMAAFALNSSILLALIIFPLIYPEALPSQAIAFLMAVPPPPVSIAPTPARAIAHPAAASSVLMPNPMAAPRQADPLISIAKSPQQPAMPSSIGGLDLGGATLGGTGSLPIPTTEPPVVRPAAPSTMRISSGVAASIAVYKATPLYPIIAKTAGVQGTVVLAATISKAGTVDDLRVVSGPPMLQLAALNAVRQWRYKPYLLNGEPVAVETTVNVIFTLQR
jgi:protein TonB